MGGIVGGVGIDYSMLMFKNLTLQGKFMYEREAVVQMIKMVEKGT
jgi:predicted RND superfamily exporter protein